MIGDVKQSIYAFRQSSPHIFISKFNKFQNDGKDNQLINFNTNYRSDKNILEFNNLVFDNLITPETIGIDYKNTSYIWGPGTNDAIGNFLATFTPNFFKTVPVGEFVGQLKYWPWFWLIVPVYVLVTPLSFAISMIFDSKSLKNDIKAKFGKKKNEVEV